MAITFIRSASTGGVSSTITVNIQSSGTDRLLVFGLAWKEGSPTPPTTVQFGSITMTLKRAGTDAADAQVRLYYKVNPAISTADCKAIFSSSERRCGFAALFNGVDQDTPFSGDAEAQGSDANPTVNISSAIDEMCVDICSQVSAGPDSADTNSGTLICDEVATGGGSDCRGLGQYDVGATTRTMEYTLTGSDDWSIIAASIQPSITAGPVYGTATSNSSASTAGKGKKNTQGSATSNASATTVGVGSKTTYGTATANASATTVGVGSKLLMGKATSNASASTIGIGRSSLTGTATSNASSTTIATSNATRPGSATANASASTVAKGGNIVPGTATANASASTDGTSNVSRPGTATANASAATDATSNATRTGTATLTCGGTTIVIAKALRPGTATSNASASTIGAGIITAQGTATANASASTAAKGGNTSSSSARANAGATTIAVSKVAKQGTATSNASADTNGIGKRILKESATANASSSTIGVGRSLVTGTATANASASTEATGGTSSTSSASLTCGATTIAIGRASKQGTATGNTSASTNGIGKRILKESATASANAATIAIGRKRAQATATALSSALTEAIGQSIAGNTASLTCGATTVAIGSKVKFGTATANASANASAIGDIFILGIATANAGANASAIGVTLGLESGITSGCLIAMITNGIFICEEIVPYVPPVPLPGSVLEYSPATLLRHYTISIITLLQSPSGVAVWPAYLGSLPDGDEVPDDAAALYDTYGWKDGRVSDGDTIEHYGVQLKIRSKEYEDGWEKIEQIAAAYDGISYYGPLTFESADFFLYNVSRHGSTMTLGVEPGTKRRWAFTANFLVSLKQVQVA